MSEPMLPAVEIESGHAPSASVIWLHGLGADGHDFEPIVPDLGLPGHPAIRFVFPHAPGIPVSINGGYIMPAWYDIRHSDLGIEHDGEGIARSARQIRLLIEQERMRGIDGHRIIVAGFSQGAAMALHVGLTHRERLCGIIALSGYLLQREELAAGRSKENGDTPVFMAHGVEDPVVPFALGESARHTLDAWGHDVEWHAYPMAHQVCAEEIRAIGRWIADRLIPSSQTGDPDI